MSLDKFLDRESSLGERDSTGSFTVDLSRAVQKLSDSALPSPHHFLLKVTQVANRLAATRLDLRNSRTQTMIRFEVEPQTCKELDLEAVARTLQNPLSAPSPLVQDLVLALLGTLHPENRSISWSMVGPGQNRCLSIDERRQALLHTLDRHEEGSQVVRVEMLLTHSSGWQFWRNSRRRAESASILQHHCEFSAARINIDGRDIATPTSSSLNEHLREVGQARFNFVTGAFENTRSKVAASNIVFELAEPCKPALSLLRPSLSAYSVKQGDLNLWTQGTRFGNTLRPDGESSSAWMLQFVRGGKNVSIRRTRKRDRYRAVLTMNLIGAGNTEPLRLKIVRHGVLIYDSPAWVADQRLEAFRGCTLLLADDQLQTDLSGLQLVRNEHFLNVVLRERRLLELGEEYFVRAEELVNFS